MAAKDFFHALLRYGCVHVGTQGSHFKVENPVSGSRTVIPIHGNRDLSVPFMKTILVQLGVDADDFFGSM
jgi:predicted RNA binding protein YcfA (HicA-like mRNA interferase family)